MFLSLTHPHSQNEYQMCIRIYVQICIRIYIFNFKTNKQTNKQTETTRKQNAKETREEKRISVEYLRGYNDIICKFGLCTFYLLDQMVDFFWLFIYDVPYVQQKKYSICYTTTTYDVHTFKTKIKENH